MTAPRLTRARGGGLGLLIVALAAGWVVTARMGSASGRPLAVGNRDGAGDAAVSQRLRAVVPAAVGCVAQSNSALQCRSDGFDIEYRAVDAGSLSTVYLDAIGSMATSSAGAPGCARGRSDERAWSTPDRPRQVAGRFACGRAQGRATMWWTVADRGVLARADAPNADIAALYGWWLAHSER